MTLSTLSDKEEALRVFGDALSTIAARRDPSSLPALEALINTRGSGFLSPAEEAAHALRPKASELWLDLKREVGDLSIAEIFYGLVPDSPVRLSPGLSRQAVEASGAEGRAYLLRTLTRPDLPFDGWRHGVMAYQMSQVLDDPGFALTDAEVSRVVTEGGAYGRAVVLHHLPAEKASKLRACSSPSSRRRAHRATWSFSSDCSAGSNRCRRAWRIAAGRFC